MVLFRGERGGFPPVAGSLQEQEQKQEREQKREQKWEQEREQKWEQERAEPARRAGSPGRSEVSER
ncbi:hypothetical protein [Georgenia muralis]